MLFMFIHEITKGCFFFNYSNLFNQQRPSRENGYQDVILESSCTSNCEVENAPFYVRTSSRKEHLQLRYI